MRRSEYDFATTAPLDLTCETASDSSVPLFIFTISSSVTYSSSALEKRAIETVTKKRKRAMNNFTERFLDMVIYDILPISENRWNLLNNPTEKSCKVYATCIGSN
jgi:predicted acyltransferase